jgi:hypothetical protein
MSRHDNEIHGDRTGVKMPQEAAAIEARLIPPEPKAPEWMDLPPPPPPGKYGNAIPYNHAPVLLTPDGEAAVIAQWQVSRKFDRGWKPFGFWAARNMGGKAVPFEPLGWKELRE